MTDKAVMQQALLWFENHGAVVFSGGGMTSVDSMNAVAKRLRNALASPQPVQSTMEKILHLVHVLENSAAIDGRENHPSDRTEQAYEQVVFALREALAQPVQPAERDALQADAARINWLTASTESHGFCHTGFGKYRYYAHQFDGSRNVRDLIDKAMKEIK